MTDGFQAAQVLTRTYVVLAMFLFFLIIFQFTVGESVGIVRTEDDQPREYWTILGIETGVFGLVVVLLYLHTH
jgi:hypothetical protein